GRQSAATARSARPALWAGGRRDPDPRRGAAAAGSLLLQRRGVCARGRTHAALGNGRGATTHHRGGRTRRAAGHRPALRPRRAGRRCSCGATMSASQSSAPGRLVALDAHGAASALTPHEAARLVDAALAAEPGAVLLRPSPAARAILAEIDRRVPVVAV